MNGYGNMTPLCTQYQNPFGSDGGKRAGVSSQLLPTFSYMPRTSFSSTSFHNSLPQVYPTCSSSCSVYPFNSGPLSVTQQAPMNGDGNMTPLSTQQYQTPLGNEGGKRTGVSSSPLIPDSPHSQVPPLTRYPAGSPHFSPGPRLLTQPLHTLPYLPYTSRSSTSFHNSLPPMNGDGNMTPLSTQNPNPLGNDGGKRTGVSASPLIPVSPYSQDPPLTRYPAGSPHFSQRMSMQPLPTFSYLPHMSPSSAPSHNSLPPVYSTCSSSHRDSLLPMHPLNSGPRSVSQPAPVFSSLPPSPPPVAPSLRSVRRKSLPPKHVENTNTSIGFNQNPSPLPPLVPVTRSNSMSVSGSNTMTSHTRTNGDITGTNSSIPLNPPESSYLPLSDPLVADSTYHMEDVVEWLYDENATKEFYNEYMNIQDNTNNDATGNETVDDEMITIHNADGESNATKKRFKTGPTTSGVKRMAGKDINPSMDNKFNDMVEPSPSPGNLPVDGTKNASSSKLRKGDYTAAELKEIARCTTLQKFAADPKKVRRTLAKRASAIRSQQRKMQYVATLEKTVKTLEDEGTSMSRKITDLEKDKMTITNENREMMIRVESLEKEGQLRDALTEQRRKAAAALYDQESVVAQRLTEELAVYQQLSAEFERLKLKLNHGQYDGSNMQPMDQNMYQEPNINQFNQPPQPLDPNMFQQPNIDQFIEQFDFYGQI